MSRSRTYPGELLAWGRSGAYYPNLKPDKKSIQDLRQVQEQLVAQNPGIPVEPIDDLHMTVLYLSPTKLYKYLKGFDQSVDEETLYIELALAYGSMLGDFKPKVAAVRGIENFASGRFGSAAVLRLEQSGEVGFWRQRVRALVVEALSRHGMTDHVAESMLAMPEFRWTVGESQPHISLASSVGQLAVRSVDLPETIGFDEFRPGSVMAPVADQERWYTKPYPLERPEVI